MAGATRLKQQKTQVELKFYVPDEIRDQALDRMEASGRTDFTFSISVGFLFVSMIEEGHVETLIGSGVECVREHLPEAQLVAVRCAYQA